MSSQTLATEKASRPYKKDLLILEQLVTKDFKLKYRRSFLGVLWSVLNPLLMMIVMSIVFSYMFGSNVPNFPLYLIVGNVTFSLMSDSTNAALTSIINAAPLLKKVKVNRYIFPVQKVLFALVNFAFSLIAVAIGALSVFFRDIIHLWSVIIIAWTYLTPIFWDLSLLIDKGAPHWIIMLVKINPMYNYLEFMRDIFLWQQNPTPTVLLMCIAWAIIALIIGIFVFKKTEHKFILYV